MAEEKYWRLPKGDGDLGELLTLTRCFPCEVDPDYKDIKRRTIGYQMHTIGEFFQNGERERVRLYSDQEGVGFKGVVKLAELLYANGIPFSYRPPISTAIERIEQNINVAKRRVEGEQERYDSQRTEGLEKIDVLRAIGALEVCVEKSSEESQ